MNQGFFLKNLNEQIYFQSNLFSRNTKNILTYKTYTLTIIIVYYNIPDTTLLNTNLILCLQHKYSIIKIFFFFILFCNLDVVYDCYHKGSKKSKLFCFYLQVRTVCVQKKIILSLLKPQYHVLRKIKVSCKSVGRSGYIRHCYYYVCKYIFSTLYGLWYPGCKNKTNCSVLDFKYVFRSLCSVHYACKAHPHIILIIQDVISQPGIHITTCIRVIYVLMLCRYMTYIQIEMDRTNFYEFVFVLCANHKKYIKMKKDKIYPKKLHKNENPQQKTIGQTRPHT